MKLSRLFAVLSVLALSLSLLSGCGASPSGTGPSAGTGSSSAGSSAAGSSASQSQEEGFSFNDVSQLEFWFGSGVGAWCTTLQIQPDGSFEGQYHDSDMGDTGDGYPNGKCYLSNFSGSFTQPVKVNDYTYSVTIADISTEQPAGTTEIEDGVLYSYTDPYGLDNAQEILFYLPGAPVAELPEGFKSWVSSYGDLGETLPFCGLYNVNAAEGFSSYDLAEPAPDADSAG